MQVEMDLHVLRKNLKQRKRRSTTQFDTVCFVLQVIQKYMPGGFAGADKDGSPILVELFGYLDFKGMIYSAKKVDIEKSKLKLGEEITEKLEAQSKQVRHVMMHASTQFAFKNVPYHPI